VGIANLMPTTVDTETQLLRLLSSSPLKIDISLLRMGSHRSTHAPPGHLEKFYINVDDAMHERFDALIITGAPVETLPFEKVDYWSQLAETLDWARDNVFSTMHICWGAQAGLYRRYGIEKYELPAKLFGVFEHSYIKGFHPLFRGFDDVFWAPHSRYTQSDPLAIQREKRLTVLAQGEEAGILLVSTRDCRELYITGHLEYDTLTLDAEYQRDIKRGIKIAVPKNYYVEDNPEKGVLVRWRSAGTLLFRNWLNLVYQETPFDLSTL
jgi:homoserine O-succinyltransferase